MQTFKCYTCKEEKPGSELGQLTPIARVGLFISGILLARSWSWPRSVCKNCEQDTNRTGQLGFGVSAAIILVGLLILIESQ